MRSENPALAVRLVSVYRQTSYRQIAVKVPPPNQLPKVAFTPSIQTDSWAFPYAPDEFGIVPNTRGRLVYHFIGT